MKSHMNEIAYGLCVHNRIENAKRLRNMWVVQTDAEKPVDGRCKDMASEKNR